jgi:murein DD-endopeptidase MepM/ murein hydrolase activator NlpD
VVAEGTNVTQGDLVAYSGESASGFDHLHFDLARGASYEQNNTHPLLYLPYNNTQSPVVSRPLSEYFDISSRVVNFTVTVDSDELDLLGVTVNGSINSGSTQFDGTFDFPEMNHNTENKTALDNSSQTLPNGVIVTVYPESHNKYNTECVIHFAFDFSASIAGGVTITDF